MGSNGCGWEWGADKKWGSKHANSRLTNEDVLSIRETYVAGKVGYTTLAKKFGVSSTTIQRIVLNKIWKNIMSTVEPNLKDFFITLARSHGGPGYVLVKAEDESEARTKMFDNYGNKWAFIYSKFERVHVLDRIKLGQID